MTVFCKNTEIASIDHEKIWLLTRNNCLYLRWPPIQPLSLWHTAFLSLCVHPPLCFCFTISPSVSALLCPTLFLLYYLYPSLCFTIYILRSFFFTVYILLSFFLLLDQAWQIYEYKDNIFEETCTSRKRIANLLVFNPLCRR